MEEEFGTEEPMLYELREKTDSKAVGQMVTATVEDHGVKVYRII